MKCGKCKEDKNPHALIKTEVTSTGDVEKLCGKCHREWADIENDFIKQKDEAIRKWLNS